MQGDRPSSKVLFLTGGEHHDFEGLAPILAQALTQTGGFDVAVTQDRDALVAPRIAPYNVVLFYTQGGEITEAQKQGLLAFVERGGGYVGLHSATATFKESGDYQRLLGARFLGHGFGEFRVEVLDHEHPITAGLADFTITDEDFRHELIGDGVRVLARWSHNGQPAIWVREWGQGRVAYCALGHDQRAWGHPTFREVAVRMVHWAAVKGPRSRSGSPFP
jgi:type 1 glutamine amidotransferase